MALHQAIRVKVSTSTTGTGTFSLGAATSTAFQDFAAAAVPTGSTVDYSAFTATQFESGTGVYTDGSPDTLTRVTIYASSNAGAVVNFSSSPTVICTLLPVRLTELLDVDDFIAGSDTALVFTSNSGDVTPNNQMLGGSAAPASFALARFSNDSNEPRLFLGKSRGTSLGSYTIVQDGDDLGSIIWNAADGVSFEVAARIGAEVDGTPGANDMPSKLVFATTPDGQGSASTKWSIGASGILATENSGSGLIIGDTAFQTVEISNSQFTPRMEILGGTTAQTAMALVMYSNDTNGPNIVMGKSRSGTIGTNTVVQDGDGLGRIVWNAADGSSLQGAANIRANIDGTPGAGDVPTKITFATTANGLSNPTDRWVINSSGDLYSIGAAGNQNGILAGSGSSATGSRFTVETTGGSGTCINQFVSTDSAPAGFFRWDTSAGNRATSIHIARAYSETIGTMTIIPAGHDIGEINFLASDGSTFEACAYIRIVNDNLTVNSTRADPGALTESDDAPALTSIPGTIWFATTQGGSSGPTRRWAINSVGTLFPYSDNSYNLGKTDARPAETYLGPIVDCESIDTGATGPILSLFHNSSDPDAADLVGQIEVYGNDTTGAKTLYGELRCILDDPTNGTEDSSWVLAGIVNAVATDYLTATSTLITTPGSHLAASATAIPAGGTAGVGYRFSSTSNFGIFFGSGAPTLSAAQGSLYLRSDGSSGSTRAYINTNGTTGWTNITTAT
jgi:hypothetical protein